MRIDREEKRSLKRLIVGILIVALVITMLPFGNYGTAIARAETTKFDQRIFGDVEPTVVDSTDAFEAALVRAAAGETIIIELSSSISVQSLAFPAANIAIDLGAYTFSVGYMSFTESINGSNIAFYGEKNSAILGYSEDGIEDVTFLCELSPNYAVNLQFNGEINLTYMRLMAFPGNEVHINDKNLSVTEEGYIRYYQQDNYSCINANQGKMIYEYLSNDYMGEWLSIDEKNGGNAFDIYNFAPPQSSQAGEDYYVKGAIPADVKILYQGYYHENLNQDSDIIEDREIGLYRNTTAESEIIIDAISDNYSSMQITDTSVQWNISSRFPSLLVDREYSKATITKDAIPTNSLDGVQSVDSVRISGMEALSLETEGFGFNLHFDITDGTPMQIFNESIATVTASDNSVVWIPWSGLPEMTPGECVCTIEDGAIVENENGIYIKSGSKITITPEGENYISQIFWGPDVMLNSSLVECCTDGTIIITVPNFAINEGLTFTVNEMSQRTASSTYMNIPTPLFTEGADTDTPVDYYDTQFTVAGAENYIICDADLAATNASGWSTEGISITEEGTHTKRYYVMDVSMKVDIDDEDWDGDTTDMIPSDTYGLRYCLTHNYVLDLTTPTITSITATDENGNVMTLDGSWVEEFDTVDAETAWTNTSSITLKAAATAGSGLPVAGYMFKDEWQTSDTYTYTGDGIYEVIIHARDEFDTKLETANKTRAEAGVWVTSIGIDTTAPMLMFTDAKNPTASVLKSNAEYEGNLHVVCDDGNGSGFAEINLYKKMGDQWITSNDLLIATEEGSFIAPTTQNEVYKIEVIDVAGNETLYDNITVVGYEQDVEVNVGEATGIYGEDLEIEVTVKNTSDNKLDISLFGLREDATDDAFTMEVDSVTELAAGESFTTKILLPKGANAGDYEAMLDMTYTNMDEDASQRITKAYSQQIVATLGKAAGMGTVTVENIIYGQTVNATVASDTNGTENVALYYKQADADDATYTTEAPTEAGSYKAKAVFAATTNYKEVVAEATFTIEKAAGTGTVTVEDFYYGQSATVTVASNTNGTENVTVYYKQADADDTTYTTEVPRLTGTYKVKAVFAATANYNEVVAEDEFTITRISETRGMYAISSPNEDGVYEGPVVITGLDGNLLCVSESGTYRQQITLSQSISFYRFYIKTPDGAITEAVILRNIIIEEPPVKVTAGRAHLDSGAAYEFGEGTWTVSGDSTNYAGGNVFYVPESGDYEFTLQEGGQ